MSSDIVDGYRVVDWCVDPNDESGRNFQQNVFGPICVPSGLCGADGRRVKATANLCPTMANSSTESHYKGIKMEKPSSVIFSSSHDSFYCNFTRQPWLLDRSPFQIGFTIILLCLRPLT